MPTELVLLPLWMDDDVHKGGRGGEGGGGSRSRSLFPRSFISFVVL